MSRPSPEMLAAKGTEDGHQAALFCWIANEVAENRLLWVFNLIFAIPNGGKRGDDARSQKITGGRLKQTGVKSGVPDMFWPVPRGHYAGLFIELKRPKSASKNQGRISEEQTQWHKDLRSQNYCVVTCLGWEAARDTMNSYYYGKI